MKSLVTGSSGFLGRFLTNKLTSLGHEVISLHSKNCDLTSEDSLKSFSHIRYDYIFHLAAWTQAGDFCLHHPAEQWLINQKINTNILSFWQKNQSQAKLIAIGTSCSYDPTLPLSEDYYLTGKPIDSLFTYAMTKRMLLSGLKALNKQWGLRYLYLIPSTLYGPYYHTDKRQLHFIFDLIRKFLRAKHFGEKVTLWGDGEQKRELIHVEDFCDALILLNDKIENEIINIGSGQEHSIKEFATLLAEMTHYPLEKVEYDKSRYVGARSKVLNIHRLHTLLPEFKIRPLEVGLKETLLWCEKHLDALG